MLDFSSWNKPWSIDSPAGQLRSSDLWVFAIAIALWVGFLSFTFGGSANSATNWVKDDENFSQMVRSGTLLSTLAYAIALIGIGLLWVFRRYQPSALGLNGFGHMSIIFVIGAWLGGDMLILLISAAYIGQPGMDVLVEVGNAYLAANKQNVGVYFLFWLVVIFLKPITMQLVYRGWIFGWLRLRVNFWIAALVSSLLFAAAQTAALDQYLEYSTYFAGSMRAVIFVVQGMVLCMLYEVSKSLWPGMILAVLQPMLQLSAA